MSTCFHPPYKTHHLWSKTLQMISNVPCELVDERLTSFEAKQLAQMDTKDHRIDDLAAKIFLDDWIERHVNTN